MQVPVIITRPTAQAGDLAAGVRALGRPVELFALFDILPLLDRAPLLGVLDRLSDYAMVAFVSPNAIQMACAEQRVWPRTLTLAVMGEGSRRALARFGISDATHHIIRPQNVHQTDSQTLLAELDLPALRGQRVLILRGESGRELLADALRDAGVLVEQVAAYRRSPPLLDVARQTQLQGLLASENDWIITSSEALRFLLGMVEQVAGEQGLAQIRRQRLIVPHHRIHETAKNLGFSTLYLTGSGDEQLLAALQSSP